MKTFVFLISLFAFCSAFAPAGKNPQSEGYAVIVNKENPVDALSASEVKLYYMRKLKSRWPVINKNIKPATRKSKCPERDAFCNNVLKMTDAETDNYFAERQFQNAEKQPDRFSSDGEMIDFVAQEVGAIGFVNIKSISAETRAKVKVVLEF